MPDERSRNQDIETQLHTGHRPELGWIARAGEWVDVLPSLRLIRVLRIAASPTAFAGVGLVYAVWRIGIAVCGGDEYLGTPVTAEWTPIDAAAHVLLAINPISFVLGPGTWSGFLAFWLWTVVLWVPPLLMLTRQGALLTAGREPMRLGDLGAMSAKRTPLAWLATVIPAACVAMLWLAVLLCLAVGGWIGDNRATAPVFALLAGVPLLACGVLGFGSLFAIPISMAAIINEPAGDPLDSLSRGYESIFRRPIHLFGHALVGGFFVAVIASMALGVAAISLAMIPVWVLPEGSIVGESLVRGVTFFPKIVVFALSWGDGRRDLSADAA